MFDNIYIYCANYGLLYQNMPSHIQWASNHILNVSIEWNERLWDGAPAIIVCASRAWKHFICWVNISFTGFFLWIQALLLASYYGFGVFSRWIIIIKIIIDRQTTGMYGHSHNSGVITSIHIADGGPVFLFYFWHF